MLSTFRTDQPRFKFSLNSPWAISTGKILHTNEVFSLSIHVVTFSQYKCDISKQIWDCVLHGYKCQCCTPKCIYEHLDPSAALGRLWMRQSISVEFSAGLSIWQAWQIPRVSGHRGLTFLPQASVGLKPVLVEFNQNVGFKTQNVEPKVWKCGVPLQWIMRPATLFVTDKICSRHVNLKSRKHYRYNEPTGGGSFWGR